MSYNYIYLLHEKEYVDTKKNVYKIGRSTQGNTERVKNGYPAGSRLLLQIRCDDCHSMETYLIREFKDLFKLHRGREYFEGDVFLMINLIFTSIQTECSESECEFILNDGFSCLTTKGKKGSRINYTVKPTKDIVEASFDFLDTQRNSHDEIEGLRKQIKNMKFDHKCITEKHMIHIQKLIAERNHMNNTYTSFKTSYDYLSQKCDSQKKEYELIRKNNIALLNEKNGLFKNNEHMKYELNIKSFKIVKLKEEINILQDNNNIHEKRNIELFDMFHALEKKVKKKFCIHILGRTLFLYSLYLNMYHVPYRLLNWSIFIVGGFSVFF